MIMKTLLKCIVALQVIALCVVGCSPQALTSKTTLDASPESKHGWKLGAQAYTFKLYTFFEVLDKLDSCGLKYVEASPGRQIGGGMEGKMDYHMDTTKQQRIQAQLKAKGIQWISYGVVVPKTKEDWLLLFEFSKKMGIENIVTEPTREDLPLISELADKYKINIAIHNHPEPSPYWHPDTLLNAVRGYSKRIGACADLGHWVRSGLDPLECIKKLEGRVIELHVKDLNEKGKDSHDVIWGTGISNIKGIMEELKRQKFKGGFFAEYEHNWERNVEDVAECVKYFRQVSEKL
jgi:Sugar phosphate isomerases/epimerases